MDEMYYGIGGIVALIASIPGITYVMNHWGSKTKREINGNKIFTSPLGISSSRIYICKGNIRVVKDINAYTKQRYRKITGKDGLVERVTLLTAAAFEHDISDVISIKRDDEYNGPREKRILKKADKVLKKMILKYGC